MAKANGMTDGQLIQQVGVKSQFSHMQLKILFQLRLLIYLFVIIIKRIPMQLRNTKTEIPPCLNVSQWLWLICRVLISAVCVRLQLALLGWLKTDSVQCKELLTALTGMQVARELLDRLSGQSQIDAYRVRCICFFC